MNFSFTFKSYSRNLLSEVERDINSKIARMDLDNVVLKEQMEAERDRIIRSIEAHKANISAIG